MPDGNATPQAGTARARAIARVHALLDEPLHEAAEAGFVIVAPLGEIVDAVTTEFGDTALRLPRYYPADEGKAWLLGTTRHVDPDTGQPKNMYVRWRTGLPTGRVAVQIVEADSADAASGVGGLDLAEFTAAPDTLPHTLRALLAACEHSAAAGGGVV